MPRTRSQATVTAQPSIKAFTSNRTRTRGTLKNLNAANISSENVPAKKIKTNKNKIVEVNYDSSWSQQYNEPLKIEGRATRSGRIKIGAHQDQRLRSTSTDSTPDSTISTITTASNVSSKENQPIIAQQPKQITPQKKVLAASTQENLVTHKRKRVASKTDEGFNFKNSPTEPEQALKSVNELPKRNKISTTPKAVAKKAEAVKQPEKEVAPEPVTPTPASVQTKPETPPQKLSMKERIARIKAKKAEMDQQKAQAQETAKPVPVSQPKTAAKPEISASRKQSMAMRIAAIKNSVAASKLARDKTKEKRNELISELNQLAQQPVQACTPEFLNEINSKVLKSLSLPITYQKLKKHFKCLDEVMLQLHNRKENITVDRIERDVTRYNKEDNFGKDEIRQIHYVNSENFVLKWKRGLRLETSELESSKIRTDAYQLTIKPKLQDFKAKKAGVNQASASVSGTDSGLGSMTNSSESSAPPPEKSWIRMTVKHLQTRLSDFTKRLLTYTHTAHNKFLKTTFGLDDEEVAEKYSLSKIKNWHPDFNLEAYTAVDFDADSNIKTRVDEIKSGKILMIPKADFPLNPCCDSLYSTPNHSREQTPMSARKLLNQFVEKEKMKLEEEADSGCDSTPVKSRDATSTGNLMTPKKEDFQAQTSAASTQNSTPIKNDESEIQLDEKYKNMPKSLRDKYLKRLQKEKNDQIFKNKLDNVKNLQEMKSLYDIARGLKSYFTIQKACSGPLTEIVNKMVKNTANSLNYNDIVGRIEKLVGLKPIQEVGSLQIEKAADGVKYVKIKPNTTLISFNNAIKLSIERIERE